MLGIIAEIGGLETLGAGFGPVGRLLAGMN